MPSSNSVLPEAWITAPATDARQTFLFDQHLYIFLASLAPFALESLSNSVCLPIEWFNFVPYLFEYKFGQFRTKLNGLLRMKTSSIAFFEDLSSTQVSDNAHGYFHEFVGNVL